MKSEDQHTHQFLRGNPTLKGKAEQWSTIRASDGDKGGPQQQFGAGGTPLPAQAVNWATPTSSTAKGGAPQDSKGKRDLRLDVENWQTPTADRVGQRTDIQFSGDGRTKPNTLGWQVGQWQTPAVDSFRCRGGDRKEEEEGLDQQARSFSMWPTAAARDSKGSPKELIRPDGKSRLDQLDRVAENWITPHGMTGIDHTGKAGAGGNFAQQACRFSLPDPTTSSDGEPSSNETTASRQLSPRFVCWLMGWPMTVPGGSDSWETEFARFRQRMRFALCGLCSAVPTCSPLTKAA